MIYDKYYADRYLDLATVYSGYRWSSMAFLIVHTEIYIFLNRLTLYLRVSLFAIGNCSVAKAQSNSLTGLA